YLVSAEHINAKNNTLSIGEGQSSDMTEPVTVGNTLSWHMSAAQLETVKQDAQYRRYMEAHENMAALQDKIVVMLKTIDFANAFLQEDTLQKLVADVHDQCMDALKPLSATAFKDLINGKHSELAARIKNYLIDSIRTQIA